MSFRCSGVRVLTVACVPTGAKTGVRRSPCGVEKIPVRARLFLAVMLNSNIDGNYNGRRPRLENEDLQTHKQLHRGKNQPTTKLVRFIKKLRNVASGKRSWFAGIRYNKRLSRIQINISTTIRLTRYCWKNIFSASHKMDWVIRFARMLVSRIDPRGFLRQRAY